MPNPTLEPRPPMHLRTSAEGRLKSTTVVPGQGWTTGAQALTLLHKLASSAAGASDALKLLHELQVHQVELDLQHEQLEHTRRDLTEQLNRQAALYEFAPVGYFVVGRDGLIVQGNHAGARLFGVPQEELGALHIGSLLAEASRPVVMDLLQRLRTVGACASCDVPAAAGVGATGGFKLAASLSPDGTSFLVVLMHFADSEVPSQPA